MDWKRMESRNEATILLEEETEVGFDFDFDAPKLYDFTIEETESETKASELWFDSTGGYQPLPVCTNYSLKWRNTHEFLIENSSIHSALTKSVDSARSCQRTSQGSKTSDVEPYQPTKQSPRKVSNFMIPTSSHLAKQHNAPDIRCERLLRRFQSFSFKDERKSLRSTRAESRATKRQKLDNGYLFKIVQRPEILSRRCEMTGRRGFCSIRASTGVCLPSGC